MHFFEDVTAKEVVPFIRTANVAIVPYLDISGNSRFALPNGLFQVLAAGMPTVFPPLNAIISILKIYSVGECVDLAYPKKIAQAISHVMRSEFKDVTRSEALRFSSDHSWQLEEKKLRHLLIDLSNKN